MSEILPEEREYLAETLAFLMSELDDKLGVLKNNRKDLIEFNREMSRETVSHTNDMDRNYEILQYLRMFTDLARTAQVADNQVKKYQKMLAAPYFGRFDFREDGYELVEKFYVGYFNLMSPNGKRVYVVDWRAPISSMYYRYELGRAGFSAASGKIDGELLLKRQYKIEGGELRYHFDSGVVINDTILCDILSNNTTGRMKTIVETIQKEQDAVIRDVQHDVVAVQGVAGSGKTNVALHRIAYLLYEGEKKGLDRGSMLIISPNDVFSDYISEVLPTLGEDEANQTMLNKILNENLRGLGLRIQSKNSYIEQLISAAPRKREALFAASNYKRSKEYAAVIDAYIERYLRRTHEFEDVYFNNELMITGSELKSLFLDNKIHASAESSLNRLNGRVMEKIQENVPKLYARLYGLAQENPKMRFEEKKNADRLLENVISSVKEKLKGQFSLDPRKLYYNLISDENLFRSLAEKEPPKELWRAQAAATKSMEKGFLPYDDACAMLYMKLKLSTNREMAHIKHVVVDEAQDYGVIHMLCFRMLYPQAKFTVLGDANQTIDAAGGGGISQTLSRAFPDKNVALFHLDKCYRSSFEISEYAAGIIGLPRGTGFDRHAAAPIELFPNENAGETALGLIEKTAREYMEGNYNSVAIITKSIESARYIRDNCSLDKSKLSFYRENNPSRMLGTGSVSILPVYMAKGLEFDAVIVYGEDFADGDEFTKRLKYTACTRPLHRLAIIGGALRNGR